MNLNIVGIGGTNGSGKDTVGQMLAKRHGWLFVSGSEMLREELRKRGLPIERENLRALSAEWRREKGLGILIDKAVEQLSASKGKYKGLAIASLRNPGEADHVHELGGIVVWIDADPKIRFERTLSRQRSIEDKKTYEQFLIIQEAEMNQGKDQATLSLAGVKAKADIFLQNNGDNIEAFKDTAEKALSNKGLGL